MNEGEGLIAVIVGIDGYKDKPLHCAVNDAVYLTETLQKVWKDRVVTIKTLIWPSLNTEKAESQREAWGIELPKDASEVTREGILTEVRACADLARESDTFIFYFSGHGVLSHQEPALVTIGDGKTAEGTENLKITDIQKAAAECASKKKVMILDCCQSLTGKSKREEGYKNLKDLTRGWSIFLAASPGEASLEDRYSGKIQDDYLQQGLFTASLAAGLRGEAVGSSGSVSLADLAYFVGKRVPVEYLERLEAIILSEKGDQNQNDTGGTGLFSQNPVLLSDVVAMGGPYSIIMAPDFVPTSQSARKKIPGKHFIKNWFKFLVNPWPIEFPFKLAFRLIALAYAATMMFTILWNYPNAIDTTILIFSTVVGLGSAFIWWITLSFAVAANEDRWHLGGYITLLFYLLWHCLVAIVFAGIYGAEPNSSQEISPFVYVVTDLFIIFAGVVVFGCNTSQSIIALAETIRKDERREIRQAIRAFQQFKYTRVGVDLYNYIAAVSTRPDLYVIGWIISSAVIGFNIYQVTTSIDTQTLRSWVFFMRNIFALILVTWLVFWYQAAFKYIQREVYKR